ncbi:MAG: hypothetical protein ACJAZ3_000478 [Sphingobacteriales bacterium]|jgi:hypothetical protein
MKSYILLILALCFSSFAFSQFNYSSTDARAESLTNKMSTILSLTPEQKTKVMDVNQKTAVRVVEIEERFGNDKKGYKKSIKYAKEIRFKNISSVLSRGQVKLYKKNRKNFRINDWKSFELRKVGAGS